MATTFQPVPPRAVLQAPPVVLILGPDDDRRRKVAAHLAARGYGARTADTAREALDIARSAGVDLVLSDWPPPGMAGQALCSRLARAAPDLPLLILTESGDVDTVVQCIRHGAYDYLARPIDGDALDVKVRNALEQKRLRGAIGSLQARAGSRDSFGTLIGRSESIQAVFRRIAKIAPHGSTVLILGESGTGKEMVAREIHRRSLMAEGPFVAVNCGGVPSELIESELFGHEKGAFTGAGPARDGLFQAASGGTLFLDEIGAMPLPQQSRLLRALQEKEVRRVGGTASLRVDVRVIAATNSDLDEAMERGLFRQDLYYRLSSMIIHLPPLRERVVDIPVLGAHFVARFAERHGRRVRGLSPQTLDILCNRRWPGNVRELEHLVEQAVLFARDDLIRPGDLPGRFGGAEETELETLEQVERRHIRAVLARTAGNKLKAARILGIPRPTLYHRMRKLGIVTAEFAAPRGGTR